MRTGVAPVCQPRSCCLALLAASGLSSVPCSAPPGLDPGPSLCDGLGFAEKNCAKPAVRPLLLGPYLISNRNIVGSLINRQLPLGFTTQVSADLRDGLPAETNLHDHFSRGSPVVLRLSDFVAPFNSRGPSPKSGLGPCTPRHLARIGRDKRLRRRLSPRSLLA